MSIWFLIIAQWLLVVIGVVAAEIALRRRLSG
jgi:hypothetical protein